MPMEAAALPKFLLLDQDERVLGHCLDAEGVFVETPHDAQDVTIELLGCLPSQRMRDYLTGSKRYRQRNPLDVGGLRMLDLAGEPLADFWVGELFDWRPSAIDPQRVDVVAGWGGTVHLPVHVTCGSTGLPPGRTDPISGPAIQERTERNG